MKLLLGFAQSLLLYLVLCIATYLMLRILIDYTAFRDDVGFLRFKAPYVNYPCWKAAFYVHVFTAILGWQVVFFVGLQISLMRNRVVSEEHFSEVRRNRGALDY